jgi:hypothetical protein
LQTKKANAGMVTRFYTLLHYGSVVLSMGLLISSKLITIQVRRSLVHTSNF